MDSAVGIMIKGCTFINVEYKFKDAVPTVSFRIESKVSLFEKISFKLSVHFCKKIKRQYHKYLC